MLDEVLATAERTAADSSKVTDLHPLQPEESLQGVLEIMYSMRNWLCELGGMDEVTFQPRGGGHGPTPMPV